SVSCAVPQVVFTNDGPVNTKMTDLCHDRFRKIFLEANRWQIGRTRPGCASEGGRGWRVLLEPPSFGRKCGIGPRLLHGKTSGLLPCLRRQRKEPCGERCRLTLAT